jgi:spermidine synthase
LSAAKVLWASGFAGACTMVVELGAVRMLAPWFGASAGVWTNVIGVILLALALGYLLGAALATRPRPERSLAWVLLCSAALTAWLPACASPICSLFLPRGVSLDGAADLWLWGSLASTLILFLPPALALGCIGPLAVECVALKGGVHAGRAGGQVLAASTLGSLAGTFATTHALIPLWGIRVSFVAAASLLFVLGVVLAWSSTAPRVRADVMLWLLSTGALAAAWRWSDLRRPQPSEGVTLLAEQDSKYQALRVVQDERWGEPMRMLQVNEGLDSFQSVWTAKPGLLGPGFYYDLFALPAWWSKASARWKVAVLGLGAGTTFRVLEGASPPGVELDLTGVEIDERVIELGREWFELAPRHRVLAGVDGRSALGLLERDFDLIVLDAYAHQVEIPAHLATQEALSEMRAHLSPGGWLAINVGGFGFDDPVVAAVGNTLAAVFPGASVACRVPSSRNFVLFGRSGAAIPTPNDAQWWFEGDVARELSSSLSLPDMRRAFTHDDTRLTLRDDRSPLDVLQRQSLEQARERMVATR